MPYGCILLHGSDVARLSGLNYMLFLTPHSCLPGAFQCFLGAMLEPRRSLPEVFPKYLPGPPQERLPGVSQDPPSSLLACLPAFLPLQLAYLPSCLPCLLTWLAGWVVTCGPLAMPHNLRGWAVAPHLHPARPFSTHRACSLGQEGALEESALVSRIIRGGWAFSTHLVP